MSAARFTGAAVLLSLGLAAGGCVTAGPDTFQRVAEGRAVLADCNPQGCTGPDIQVKVYAHDIRGWVHNWAVDLQLDATHIRGSFGGRPVMLTVTPKGRALAIDGMFGGEIGQLRMSDAKIEGRIGWCSYDLHADGGRNFSGQSACGGLRFTRVQFPTTLAFVPTTQRVALYALLLAR